MSIQSNFPAVDPSLLLDFANTKQLDSRITFTRSTPAVYYDGKTTAMAEQNLFSPSVNIGSPHQNVNNTLTNNTGTAPDGTATASLLVPNSSNTRHYCTFGSYGPAGAAGTTYTVSVYAKPSGYDYIFVQFSGTVASGGSRYGVTFNITSGAIEAGGFSFTSNVTSTSAAITSAGGGWYRVSLTLTSTLTPSNPVIYVQSMSLNGSTYASGGDGLPSYAGNGTDGAFFWGGQLEQRATATAYTVTTTQPITNYIPVLLSAGGNQARFDHNPTTGESLGLLIEEQRTNLATYSADYSNAAWGKTQCSIESNTIVAPDGTLTGDKLIEDTASSVGHFITQVVSLGGSVDSSAYVFIAYAKAGQRTRIRMFDNNQNTSGDTTFNLSTGTIVSGTGTITSVGNGWYRCAIFPLKNYSTTATPRIYLDNGTSSTYTGNGFSGVYIWGGQLEVASFATSYIATTSASATRTADAASMTGINFSSWYNQAESTFYTEVSFSATSYNVSNTYHFECSDGTSSNRFLGYTGGSVAGLFVASNLVSYASLTTAAAPSLNTLFRCGFVAKTNNFALTASAVAPQTDNSGLPAVVSKLNIGSNYSNGELLNGYIKKLAYYPIAVTSAQLQALTS
jgi:hypothetical protein